MATDPGGFDRGKNDKNHEGRGNKRNDQAESTRRDKDNNDGNNHGKKR